MFREGIININKPADWTSQDVCAKLRGRLHIKHIGHTGTLDPMATGVLPICIGKATRIIEYYDQDTKSYRASMQLGIETDTLDITGNVTKTTDFGGITREDLLNVCSRFVGIIEQIPPKYSAIKINGRRAYDLAREGADVEIKPRKVNIISIDVLSFDEKRGVVDMIISCGKGTYIRSLCDDIGRALGCGATMTGLARIQNGYFTLENSYELKDVVEMTDEEINSIIISMDETITLLGTVELNSSRVKAFTNGNESYSKGYKIIKNTEYKDCYKVYSDGQFLGVGSIENEILKPEKVIILENNN